MSLHLLNEYWLEFDGVDDYVQAQLNTTLNFAMPIKVDLEFDSVAGDYIPILGKFALGPGDDRYYIIRSIAGGYVGFGAVDVQGQPANTVGPIPSTVTTNQRYLFEAEIDGGDYVFKIDGVEVDREAIAATPGPTTDYYFTVGRAYSGQTNWYFQGKIYSFQVGTEIFPLNEGSGTTITGSEGTVLDIYGATWGGQPNKEIKDVYIGDSGILKPVKYIFLGTSTGFSTVYRGEPDPGQVEFTTPGTYQWVVPDGVESISAVVVGGGGGGACSRSGTGYGAGSGGGGGGLAYNTFAVTPGETLDIIVGSVGVNGLASAQSAGGAGGFSAIQRSSTDLVRANGGLGGNWATSGNGGAVVVGTGGSGGKGGVRGTSPTEIGGGGGGAGGYSGAGGEGGGGSDATGKAGNGGAGGGAGGGNRRGGGGVGIYGEGTSGSAVASGSAGNPGSGGIGLLYGAGGGGGQGSFPNQNGQAGGAGAVRIIWGNSSVTREYPSTNTQDY